MQEFERFISDTGFPIAACCFMAYQLYKQTGVIEKLKEVINTNTLCLTTLKDVITEIRKEIEERK